MKSLRLWDRRIGFSLASLMLLLGMILPAAFPVMASAYAVLGSRSIEMSNSNATATGVTYSLTMTPTVAIASGGGFIIDFCAGSPIIGDSGSCSAAPSGFSAASAVLGTGNASTGTITAAASRITFTATATIPAASDTYNFTTITNPSSAGTFYARVYTYTSANLSGYSDPGDIGTPQDAGGIALAATNSIGVNATVMETMTFCTTSTTPTADCANASAVSLTLGSGSPVALSTAVSTNAADTAFAELSTNATSGAVVRMTNSNDCGGLRRVTAGATGCDIAATNTATALTGGEGMFGLNVGAATVLSGGAGTLTPLAPYDTSGSYGMSYTGVGTGVSSPYGDPILQSGSTPGPVSNAYVPLTFAADASNTTPAGQYSAQMNLIASGTF